jgi:sugar phosphate isomerase/epimerase
MIALGFDSYLRKMRGLTLNRSRRDFLKASSAAAIGGSPLVQSVTAYAQTLHVPLGLQLYSVREYLPTNYDGILKQVGGLGYQEVEAAGYFNHSAAEVKQAMDQAKLHLVSAHYSADDLHKQLDTIIQFNKALGVSYLICSFPGFKDPERVKKLDPRERINAFTLEDWKWNAEQLNQIGEKVHAAGLKFGYHNHFMEFHKTDGVVPYVELLRLTDPSKVTMEMDCGWVVVGGGNPIEYLRNYPTRITMLHVKDFKSLKSADGGRPVIAELGQGVIDYRPIFRQAAESGHVRHVFVEQEAFDVPWTQSLKIDADYMRKLGIGS